MKSDPSALRRIFCLILGLLALLAVLHPVTAMAEESGRTMSQAIDDALKVPADVLSKIIFYAIPIGKQALPIVLIVLGGTAIFLTLYFRFINFRAFGLAIRTVKGKYTPDDAPGQITHFQALTAALSATVGLGNIGGVAVAIGLGGPGATFWMILMGLCGMTTKFVECTLGVKYRNIDDEGRVHGGAMYYLTKGFKERGMAGLGTVLAIFFAFTVIGGAIGAGCMFQANQAQTQFSSTFGILENGVVFGTLLAVVVAAVIIGGIVWIARVTSFLVPFMCGIYVIAALVIIIGNASQIGNAFGQIFAGAFTPTAIGGGFIGVLIQGIKRAAFSNEAGLGSAPIAHSAVKTDKPASEGLVALLEPFTDTVVVCTMTALVIIMTGAWQVGSKVEDASVALLSQPVAESAEIQKLDSGQLMRNLPEESEDGNYRKVRLLNDDASATEIEGWVPAETESIKAVGGVQVTSMAFSQKISWFPRILSVAVLLFAFSTMISWSYYGEQGVIFIFGTNRTIVLLYKLFFCACVVVGSAASLGNVIALSDAMIFAMVIPNMFGVYMLLPVAKEELNKFLEFARKTDRG